MKKPLINSINAAETALTQINDAMDYKGVDIVCDPTLDKLLEELYISCQIFCARYRGAVDDKEFLQLHEII